MTTPAIAKEIKAVSAQNIILQQMQAAKISGLSTFGNSILIPNTGSARANALPKSNGLSFFGGRWFDLGPGWKPATIRLPAGGVAVHGLGDFIPGSYQKRPVSGSEGVQAGEKPATETAAATPGKAKGQSAYSILPVLAGSATASLSVWGGVRKVWEWVRDHQIPVDGVWIRPPALNNAKNYALPLTLGATLATAALTARYLAPTALRLAAYAPPSVKFGAVALAAGALGAYAIYNYSHNHNVARV